MAANGLGINFHTPKELGLKLNVEENGTTAVENAIIKAAALSQLSSMPTFAWDMGMHIEKLPENLQPNLHIRRPFGKEELSDAEKLALLEIVNELSELNAYHTTILEMGDENAAAYIATLLRQVQDVFRERLW